MSEKQFDKRKSTKVLIAHMPFLPFFLLKIFFLIPIFFLNIFFLIDHAFSPPCI
jgi:hypothetical protein